MTAQYYAENREGGNSQSLHYSLFSGFLSLFQKQLKKLALIINWLRFEKF